MKNFCRILLLIALTLAGGLSAADRTAQARAVSAKNFKRIASAILAFADSRKDYLPQSLNDLITAETIGYTKDYNGIFIAPYDKKSRPRSMNDYRVENTNTTYVYVGKGTNTGRNSLKLVTAFEDPRKVPHEIESLLVLYLDGTIQEVKVPTAMRKSCYDTAKFLLKDLKLRQDEKALVMQNAAAADQAR